MPPKLKVVKKIKKNQNFPLIARDTYEPSPIERLTTTQMKYKDGAFPIVQTSGFGQYMKMRFSDFKLEQIDPNKEFCSSKTNEIDYFPYQKLISAYLNEKTPYRGVLVYHGLGSGKTCTAILTAERFFVQDNRDIIVLAPASLKSNYTSEMKKCSRDPTIRQMMIEDNPGYFRVPIKDRVSVKGKKYKIFTYNSISLVKDLEELGPLDDKVLIVDEIHNLISTMANDSQIGKFVYDKFMNAKNTRFVFLSGTPIVNYPGELAIIGNILRGYINEQGHYSNNTNRLTGNQELFPTLMDSKVNRFHSLYLSDATFDFNKNSLQSIKRRLSGLISYYPGLQGKDVYPDVKYTVVEVKMTQYQKEIIGILEKLEKNKAKKKAVAQRNKFADEIEKVGSDFKVLLRELSNFCPPIDARPMPKGGSLRNHLEDTVVDLKMVDVDMPNGPIVVVEFKGKEMNVKKNEEPVEIGNEIKVSKKYEQLLTRGFDAIVQSSEFNINNLKQYYSPKFATCIHNIMRSLEIQAGPVLVYSFFKNNEGTRMFGKSLELYGMEPYHTDKSNKNGFKYAIYEGTKEERTNILEAYNSPDNKNGSKIAVLLITASGAEGLNLKRVRQVHILEQHWHYTRILQVIGRAKRICSHSDLDKKDQKVDVYEYISVPDFVQDIPLIIREDVPKMTGYQLEGVQSQRCPKDKYDKYVFKMYEKRKEYPFYTDQLLYITALRKQYLVEQVLHVMKESAIDCYLNYEHVKVHQQKEGLPPVKCIEYPPNPDIKMYQTSAEENLVYNPMAEFTVERVRGKSVLMIMPFNDDKMKRVQGIVRKQKNKKGDIFLTPYVNTVAKPIELPIKFKFLKEFTDKQKEKTPHLEYYVSIPLTNMNDVNNVVSGVLIEKKAIFVYDEAKRVIKFIKYM